jgi:hypothetical protein
MPLYEPTLAYCDKDHAFGSFDRVAVCIWRGLTTPAGTKDVEREIHALTAARPLPLALWTIVQPGIPMPSAETRSELSLLLKGSAGVIAASAVVIETEGFFAAAARSVVIGLTSLQHYAFPHKAFGSPEHAAQWIEATMRKAGVTSGFEAAKLLAGVRAVRALVR